MSSPEAGPAAPGSRPPVAVDPRDTSGPQNGAERGNYSIIKQLSGREICRWCPFSGCSTCRWQGGE